MRCIAKLLLSTLQTRRIATGCIPEQMSHSVPDKILACVLFKLILLMLMRTLLSRRKNSNFFYALCLDGPHPTYGVRSLIGNLQLCENTVGFQGQMPM